MMYRKHLNAPAMLLILGFNDMPQTFTIAKPQDKWRLLLNNHTEAFSTDIESPSPTELDLTKEKQQLSLPAYPVRVYQQT